MLQDMLYDMLFQGVCSVTSDNMLPRIACEMEKLKAMNTALRLRLRPKTAKRPQATIATQRQLCLPIGGEGQEQERRPADCRDPTGWLAEMGEPPTT
jgi:hypothetical protein